MPLWEKIVGWTCAALAALFVLVPLGIHFELTKSDWASWVQAIGSIGAIIGTFAVAKFQFDKQGRAKKSDDANRVAVLAEICFVLTRDTFVCLDNLHGKFVDRSAKTLPSIGTERLEELQYSLRNFAAKDIPAELHLEVLILQREVAYTLTAVRELNKVKRASPARIQKAFSRSQTVLEAKDRVRSKYEQYKATAESVQ
jgi:hypothetical protein